MQGGNRPGSKGNHMKKQNKKNALYLALTSFFATSGFLLLLIGLLKLYPGNMPMMGALVCLLVANFLNITRKIQNKKASEAQAKQQAYKK